jgi:hypothetical protein
MARCTDSHEQSDLASTMYWIEYLMPFLSFYFDTFPAVDDSWAGAAEMESMACACGYETRASFPHPSIINHITEAIQTLQTDESVGMATPWLTDA